MILSIVSAVAVGCNAPPTEPEFDSAVPAARIRATREAALTADYLAIPDLIEGLESDDPAVRFMSIETLERLTGRTYGYRHFGEPWERRAAVDRWLDAYRAGELEPGATAVATDSEPGGARR